MKYLISVFAVLCLAGCITHPDFIQKIVETPASKVITTKVYTPKYAEGPTTVSVDTNGVTEVWIASDQDQAKISKAEGSAKGVKMLYILGALGVILGGVLIAFKVTSTKGGIFIALSGIACIAMGTFAPALEKIATPTIIVVLIAGAAYFVWVKFFRKSIN